MYASVWLYQAIYRIYSSTSSIFEYSTADINATKIKPYELKIQKLRYSVMN